MAAGLEVAVDAPDWGVRGIEGRSLGSEPDYRQLVESAGDIVYSLDLEGRLTFFNAAAVRVLGYEPGELLGRRFADILTPESQRVAMEHFQRGLRGEEIPPFFEVEALRQDGSTVQLEVRAESLHRDGVVVGRQGVARDISELKLLQAEVTEKSERLELIEAQTRVAMDLYARIAQLALAPPTAVADAEDLLRRVQGSLSVATAEALGLSATDLEVIRHLAQGCSTREIAERMHLSVHTVKDRVAKLMRILGARRRAEVVAEAVRRGLL